MTSFLPDKYEVPASPSNYYKLQDGENTFRVLDSAIVGFQYWNVDKKPVRLREQPHTTPADIRLEKDGTARVKPFWAFPVWNYDTKQVQILELTQKSIMTAVKAIVDNNKWGNPTNYDITITRVGEGLETEYSVMPNPHSDTTPEIEEAFEARPVNLEALYDGADPFEVK